MKLYDEKESRMIAAMPVVKLQYFTDVLTAATLMFIALHAAYIATKMIHFIALW